MISFDEVLTQRMLQVSVELTTDLAPAYPHAVDELVTTGDAWPSTRWNWHCNEDQPSSSCLGSTSPAFDLRPPKDLRHQSCTARWAGALYSLSVRCWLILCALEDGDQQISLQPGISLTNRRWRH